MEENRAHPEGHEGGCDEPEADEVKDFREEDHPCRSAEVRARPAAEGRRDHAPEDRDADKDDPVLDRHHATPRATHDAREVADGPAPLLVGPSRAVLDDDHGPARRACRYPGLKGMKAVRAFHGGPFPD